MFEVSVRPAKDEVWGDILNKLRGRVEFNIWVRVSITDHKVGIRVRYGVRDEAIDEVWRLQCLK